MKWLYPTCKTKGTSKNSTEKVTNENIDKIQRDLNFVTEIERTYKCPIHLGIFVVGCYGEIIKTDAKIKFKNFSYK